MYNYPNYNPVYNQGLRDFQQQNMQNNSNFSQNSSQYYPQFSQFSQPMQKNIGLQGKTVDSMEVVKATEIPLDGSISYFALADGSAIATKQLLNDGTSKIIVYKPSREETEEKIKYVTSEELESKMSNFNLKDIKDIKEDIKKLKRELEDITDLIKDKKGK